jgi:hypothetical protein
MGRSGYIALSVFGLALWSWLGYFNVASALRSGVPIAYALLTPSAIGPIALVPLTLTQLWKLASAERKENVIDPQFVLKASQSLIARGIGVLMCIAFIAVGASHLLGSAWASNLPDSFVLSVIFIAIGTYGAVFALFSPRLRMGLSPDGFEYSLMNPARIPWHDISDVKLRSVFTTSWIVLTLKDSTEFRSAHLLARWRKVSKVLVYPLAFGIDPEVLKQGIDLRRNVFTFD